MTTASITPFDTGPAPLDDIRVLDLSRLVAGNILTHALADFGADVVKVERPGAGDDLRNWRVKGISVHWKVFARNKRSLALNLKSETGRALLLDLVRQADVLVENFVPGTLESWDLAPDRLLAANPDLVVVRVSGWGQTGPFREKPGFGTLVEAMSGFAAMNGYEDRPPVLPPLALADMIAGLYGATATMIAVRAVERGGARGQVIDLSLFEPIFAILGSEAAVFKLTGAPTKRLGSRTSLTAPRNVYPTADGGFVALSASMQSMVEQLFRAIGRPELIDDPRFRTNADRLANVEALDRIVGDFIGARTQDEALGFFADAGITAGPVCTIADLVDHPYIAGRGILSSYADQAMGDIPMHAVVPRLSATPGVIRRPAPEVGEHTVEILGELKLQKADLERLSAENVIGIYKPEPRE